MLLLFVFPFCFASGNLHRISVDRSVPINNNRFVCFSGTKDGRAAGKGGEGQPGETTARGAKNQR